MDFEKRIITDGETVIDKELLEYMEDGIVEAINIADNKADKSELRKYTAWGTCDTEAATAEKVIVIDDPNWKLEVGSLITVRFSATNSASNVTLNVNNTGAYGIRASTSSPYASTSGTYCGTANRAFTYIFDGSYWQWISGGAYPSSTTNVSLGQGYATCSTAAATKAKTASLSSYTLSTGGIVAVTFTNDVPASATLNINSKGAKNIYHKGAAITDGVIKAGDTATFIYSTRYHLISIDRDETFSGDYNDLTNTPAIPTKTSDLTNDSGFLTTIPSEYVTDSELNSKGYATQTFVQNEIAKIDTTTSTLPDYWKTRLDTIGEKIEELQMENGMDTLQFLWCSDIHGVPGTSPSNTTYIGDIGRYVMDKHNIPFFMVSGDIMSQASHAATANIWAEYAKLTPMLSPINNEEFLAIRGNHDGVWGSPMEYNGVANNYYHSYIGDKALFNAFMRRQTLDSHRRVFDTSGMYFYVDYHDYRIYMLNSHTFGDDSVNEQGQAVYNGFKQDVFGSKQLQWIADTLMTVKESQQVIFVAHAPITYMVDKDVFTNMLVYYRNREEYTASVDVSGTYWASGTEYSTSTVTKDFTNAKGDFLGYFNGHIHNDSMTMYGTVPMFSITCAGGDVRDAYYTNGTLARCKGTVTETAIDVVTITNDYVYCTRIGCGYDRKFNRATNEVTIDYDSAFVPEETPEIDPNKPIVYPEGSELYLNKRFSSSSGGIVGGTNTMIAIIIPIDADGVTNYSLKIENLPLSITSTTNNTLYILDSERTAIGYATDAAVFVNMTSGLTLNDDGTTAEVTFTPSASVAYLAVSITVATVAPVTEDTLKGIVITLEQYDTGLTQGDITSEVGYTLGKRYSTSNGSIKDQTGDKQALILDKIQVTGNDVIRVKGLTYPDSPGGPVVAVYDDAEQYIAGINICADYEGQISNTGTYFNIEGDLLTVTVNPDLTGYQYIGIGGYYTEPVNYTVTRNQEII